MVIAAGAWAVAVAAALLWWLPRREAFGALGAAAVSLLGIALVLLALVAAGTS